MVATPESRASVLGRIADQILHNNPHGRRLVAVEGVTANAASAFADDLAQVLRDRNESVVRRSIGSVDEETLRSEIVDPFRSGTLKGTDNDTLLLVDGERLLNNTVIGVWHYTVWTFQGDQLPHGKANFNVDLSDNEFPRDHYYDLCKLPPTFGEHG
ncbi:hypothetical protein [Paramicrobacterium chengjingii]|uniref:Uncharacterized protein n=1 Tax=Paramicrobacterium chengjingii TaxID=2769067 RepID=A0ABX6YFD7_9MICO|nr:hypothetical protein [Microbacterium chengjingii]QPZ37513.1 hypothetical protein HCR76_11790 [Microbacterium chengjingii]